jgi:hypothetical protein
MGMHNCRGSWCTFNLLRAQRVALELFNRLDDSLKTFAGGVAGRRVFRVLVIAGPASNERIPH